MSSDIETFADGYNQLMSGLAEELARTVRPVFRKRPQKQPEHVGSSILLRVGPFRLLLTARHVWNKAHEDKGELVIPGGGSKMVADCLILQAEVEAEDFVIIHLPDEYGYSEFLELSEIDLRDSNDATKVQWFFGYGAYGNKNLFSGYSKSWQGSRPNSVRMTPLSGATKWSGNVALFGKQSTSHVAVCFDPDRFMNLKGGPPTPPGTSGGGLWYLPNPTMPKPRFLSAMIVEWKKRVLLGVKLRTILAALCNHHPSLLETCPELGLVLRP